MDKLRVLKHYAFQEVTAELLNSIGDSLFEMQDGALQAFIAGFDNSDHLIFQDLDVTVDTGLTVNLGLKGVFLYRIDAETCVSGVYKGVRADKNSPWTQEQITFDAAHPTLPRIDIIEAEIVPEDDPDYFETVQLFNNLTETSFAQQKYVRRVRNVKLYKKTGVANSTPVAPLATSGRFAVREVYVGALASSLSLSDIRKTTLMFNTTNWTQGLNNTKQFPSIYKSLEYLYNNRYLKELYWMTAAFTLKSPILPSILNDGTPPNYPMFNIMLVNRQARRVFLAYNDGTRAGVSVNEIDASGNFIEISNTEHVGSVYPGTGTYKGFAVGVSKGDTIRYASYFNKIAKSINEGDTWVELSLSGISGLAGQRFGAIDRNPNTGVVVASSYDGFVTGFARLNVSNDDFVTSSTIPHPATHKPTLFADIKWLSGLNWIVGGLVHSGSDNNQYQIMYSVDDGATWNQSNLSSLEYHISKVVQFHVNEVDGLLYALVRLDVPLVPTPSQNSGLALIVSSDNGASFNYYRSFGEIATNLLTRNCFDFFDDMVWVSDGGRISIIPDDSTRDKGILFTNDDFSTFKECKMTWPVFIGSPDVGAGYFSMIAKLSATEVIVFHTSRFVAYGRRDQIPVI